MAWWRKQSHQHEVFQAFQQGVTLGQKQQPRYVDVPRCPCCGFRADLPAAERDALIQSWHDYWKRHPGSFTRLTKELERRKQQASVPTRRDLSS